MNAQKIKSIRCITAQGPGPLYEVGMTVNEQIIDRIFDNSMQWRNHVDHVYTIYGDNINRVAELINCPVEVQYFPDEEA